MGKVEATERDGVVEITFDPLPFWDGVRKTPGVGRAVPFVLESTIGSPIRQAASEQIVNDVVAAYQAEEYKFITQPPGSNRWADSLGERSIRVVENLVGEGSLKDILEIGGGSTWIASRLRERYNPESYLIVDPSVRDSAEGVEVIREYFPDPRLSGRCFDLVLGFSVLEHVPDPLHFLCNIQEHLTANGKVILIYPDCERPLQLGDLNVLVHEHLSFFTEKSSRWIASKAGFDVLSLQSCNGVFVLSLEVLSGSAAALPELDESGLLFHSATPGLNAFFFLTGLGNSRNIRLYDGDVSKQGFYLPACSTPIMSSMDGSYIENSLLVISAMSFYEQIREFAVEKAGFDPLRVLLLSGICENG